MNLGSMAQIWTGRPAEAAVGGDHGVGEAGGLLHAAEALAVGLGIDEAERIGGAQAGIEALEFGVVEEQLEAGDGVDAAVRAALGADVPVGLEVLLPDDLAAAFALLPQTFGSDPAFLISQFGELVVIPFVPLEPRHGNLTLTRVRRAAQC